MQSLPILTDVPAVPEPRFRLPAWLKRTLPSGNENFFTHTLLKDLRLETVCENARCPNRPECYSRRTATFMILGNVCTRPCGFCAVDRGRPQLPEDDEPQPRGSADVVPADDEPEGEDVLEETPEFLQETPEHDRLWFEQKPPRDFEF